MEEKLKIVGHAPSKELLSDYTSYILALSSLSVGAELQLTSRVLDTLTMKDFGKIEGILSGLPITVHAPFMGLDPGAVDEHILDYTRNRFEETLLVAKVLGAERIVFHTGYHPHKVGPIFDVWFSRAVKTFSSLKIPQGTKVALENVFDEEPSFLKRLLNELPEEFGVCIDTGHLNLFSKVSPEEWLSSFEERIYELHLHNNYGTSDEHSPLDEGNFPFEWLPEFVKKYKDKTIFNLENKSLDNIRKSLKYFFSLLEA